MNDSAASPINQDERAYVFAVVRRILRDEDAASDVTQDTLLLAYRHRDQFRGDSAYRTWLHRIAVMTALGYLRKQRRLRSRVVMSLEDDDSRAIELADPRPSPEVVLATNELAGRVGRALEALTPTYRNVFLLRVADWRESEISEELGISVANVKIRTHRARAQLREALTTLDEETPADESPLSASPRAPRARRDSRAGTSATSRAS